MADFSFPTYLLPLEALSTVEVLGPPREKTSEDGTPKKESWTGQNRMGWIIPVEIVRGTREKTLPTGKVLPVFDTEIFNVTVWMNEKPQVKPGEYVSFSGLAVGAMGGKIFLQALSVDSVDTDFTLPEVV